MSKFKMTIIGGSLGRDAEQKTINGRQYYAFSVAAQNGQSSEWFDCLKRVREGGADNLGQYLTKGSKVYIEGQPSFRVYTDRSGAQKVSVSIMVDVLELLGKPAASAPAAVAAPATAPANESPEEDLPF